MQSIQNVVIIKTIRYDVIQYNTIHYETICYKPSKNSVSLRACGTKARSTTVVFVKQQQQETTQYSPKRMVKKKEKYLMMHPRVQPSSNAVCQNHGISGCKLRQNCDFFHFCLNLSGQGCSVVVLVGGKVD